MMSTIGDNKKSWFQLEMEDMDMLVVISSEAPKTRKIYHKMGCIYAERIKFQNRLEIKVEQAEKEGYCKCKYCAGLRGDVRTHKAQILSWTHNVI